VRVFNTGNHHFSSTSVEFLRAIEDARNRVNRVQETKQELEGVDCVSIHWKNNKLEGVGKEQPTMA